MSHPEDARRFTASACGVAWQFAAVGAGAERPHDGLNRLTDFRRGTLVAGNASILDDNTSRRQILTLDSVGNWTGFKDDSGAGGANDSDWLLAQARKHNSINEIDDDNNHANAPDASITATSGTNWFDPVYDAAGNMIVCPKPGDGLISRWLRATVEL